MPPTRPLAPQSLPDLIAKDLRERILSDELAEGSAIRQEALAKDYAVSRMPIREALKRLEAEGLVQLTTNRGATVTQHSLDEIGEIFDLRLMLEVDLLSRGVPLMTAEDFDRCQQMLEQMEDSYESDDVAAWGALNWAYHAAFYAKADRGLTHDLLNRINLLCDRYVRMHLSVMEQRDAAKQEHRELLTLAQAGEVSAATDLLTRHIQRTRAELVSLIATKRAPE
ncbi:MAG: GntR family transcriptional regulator [Rhodobacteraceae bacterium]|nr:GntR family transcriptional regulator [Paracoccaceae bacterium]